MCIKISNLRNKILIKKALKKSIPLESYQKLQWINCLIQIKYRKLNQQKIISQKSSGSKKLQKKIKEKNDQTKRRSVLFVLKQKKSK
jgi:hypothetical protein